MNPLRLLPPITLCLSIWSSAAADQSLYCDNNFEPLQTAHTFDWATQLAPASTCATINPKYFGPADFAVQVWAIAEHGDAVLDISYPEKSFPIRRFDDWPVDLSVEAIDSRIFALAGLNRSTDAFAILHSDTALYTSKSSDDPDIPFVICASGYPKEGRDRISIVITYDRSCLEQADGPSIVTYFER